MAENDNRQKRYGRTQYSKEETTSSSDDERKTSRENTKSQSSRKSSLSTTTTTCVNDPLLERELDRPRSIHFELPLRSFDSSSSSSSESPNDTDSDSSSSASTSSSSDSLFDPSSDTDSDSEHSRKPSTRSRSQSSDEDFDAKNWFENDMMQMEHGLRHFCKKKPLILYYEWDAEVCRNQFRALKPHDPLYDKRRRLLNVAVMATTDRAIVKGKYIVNNETVEFNFPSRLKTILYEHLLKSRRDDDIQPLFKTTEVNVVNDDCVVVFNQLMNEGYNPVMLNMANASRPGGGFRTGASAQEEDLFRRSNYSRSLDISFAETAEKDHERLHFKPSGDCKPYRANTSMYPLEDFDAIYTRGLCFFRHDKEHGYAFMDEPLYDVCTIAMAATRDPPIEDGQLLPDLAKIMQKKMETIFAVAQKNEHDCLVLSAFGCGAFHNPPEHVANIFKSVIEKYAGVFRRIDFAIIGSSNETNKNYSIFKKVLDGLDVKAQGEVNKEDNSHEMQNNQNSSRYIKRRTLCLYGIECRLQFSEKSSTQHNARYLHPCRWSELCENQRNELHYTHEPHKAHPCQYGYLCKEIVDPIHRAKYRHENWPDFLVPCKYQQKCRDTTWSHRVKYSHGELAQKKYKQDNQSIKHLHSRIKGRSTKNRAKHSSNSRHHRNESHRRHQSNSLRQPEDISSRAKEEDKQRHRYDYDKSSAHSDKVPSSSKHNRESTSTDKRSHKTKCKYGSQCYHINDADHRSQYSH